MPGKQLLLASLIVISAQAATDRIITPIDSARPVTLKSQVRPGAEPSNDLGPAAADLALNNLTLRLQLSPAVESFLADQQNPASPNYHRWLTPEQFADRFGASTSDIAKLSAWLKSQGFTVNSAARGGAFVSFRGTAAQVSGSFHTEIHRYTVAGKQHYANATAPSIPEALSGIVASIGGLNDFHLSPLYVRNLEATPDYTSATGHHYLAPDDLATIYNIAPLYAAGIDGTGLTIAVAGQTDINIADIAAFRTRFGLSANLPQVVLAGDDPGVSAADLPEADLDLEWSGAVARNATIIFVNSTDVITSVAYAIDNAIAPIVSLSYGGCEQENDPTLRSLAQQANAEGITWISPSGDSGAAGCDFTTPTPLADKGLGVTFPASIPEITAIGGTTFNEGNEGDATFWNTTNSTTGATALSYIPEVAWNDSAERNGLAASGGGASLFFPKPAWQQGPGVPADGARDVPDIAFSASPDHDGYLVETSGGLYVFGGTSLGTPVFAGVVALLNQSLATAGLGNINPRIYALSQAKTNVFHDVISGNNNEPCLVNSPNCVNGTLGYSTGPGYDLVTGLGSLNVNNFVTEWNNGVASTTTLSTNPTTVSPSGTVQLTANITGSGMKPPTGTVTFLINDYPAGTVNVVPSGSIASATFSVTGVSLAAADGAVSALYNGDTVYNSSGASAQVTMTYPAGSAVIPSVSPAPLYQFGGGWFLDILLIEKNGVATKLTGFNFDGNPVPLSYFNSLVIPAHGIVESQLGVSNVTYPADHILQFTGVDAATRTAPGKTWTQQISVSFLGPASISLYPSMTLTSTPPSVALNPAANPSCAYSQQLVVQETNGFLVDLTNLSANTLDFSNQIQQIFGTTRLAPYGTLTGNLCWPSTITPVTGNFTIVGNSEVGQIGSAIAVPFTPTPPAPSAISLAPAGPLVLKVANSSPTATASIAVNITGGEATWNATVTPANRMTSWLTVSTTSGSGPGQIIVQASGANLPVGVYTALLTVQSPNSFPQGINVPVTLIVGPGTTSIQNVVNDASPPAGVAPGTRAQVWGYQLANTPQTATGFPLPLNLAGVTATVNGVPAPLIAVEAQQLTIQIPYETSAGTAVLGLNNNGNVAAFNFQVSVAAPAVYQASVTTGAQGQTVTLFMTGDGVETPFVATGDTPSTSAKPLLPVTVTVGGINAPVTFAGTPNGLAGVAQVNYTIPTTVPVGVQPVVVTVGGVSSAAVALTVF